jgi:biotin operon repressor
MEKVATRYAPSRRLSFDMVHVLVAFQLIYRLGRVSRSTLGSELGLGEGAVKTLIKHMKMHGLIETSNGGTRATAKGESVCSELASLLPSELVLPGSSLSLGRYNYAVLLREFGYAVKSGIEQRDAAIRTGAVGATTLLFKDGKFVMPSSNVDSLKKEQDLRKILIEKLQPQEGDVLIVGSADNLKVAELAAKNAALSTIMAHENHN